MTNLQSVMNSRTESVLESSSSSPIFSILERIPVEGGREVSLGEFFGHSNVHDEGNHEGSAETEAPDLDLAVACLTGIALMHMKCISSSH